ncbi:hypothetical protein OV208_33060 [Corallococcus sp. bb12-1]|uniref:hypothetical protein n=1 Tax=Corallococcus sp. bb12-1 TaxID=2996784 RepID=UPI00226E49D0|nr:hypothetical protein [Corallococcus sp. bb12-1]MCY1046188.1 hypothetical protein [Corallococcus sp. bb12-1]
MADFDMDAIRMEISVQQTDVIRLTDGRLRHHEHFGDSSRVVLRVSERYQVRPGGAGAAGRASS